MLETMTNLAVVTRLVIPHVSHSCLGCLSMHYAMIAAVPAAFLELVPTSAVCFSELAKLRSAAQQSLATWKESLEYECTKGTISPRLASGAGVAENRAVATQAKWGAHKTEGGLYWATYKVLPKAQSVLAG